MSVFEADPADLGDGSDDDLDLDLENDDLDGEGGDGKEGKEGEGDDKTKRRRNRPSLQRRQADRIKGLESKFDQLLSAIQRGGLAVNADKDSGKNGDLDVEALRKEIAGEIEGKANSRVIRSEARAALKEAGFRGDVKRGVRMLDLEGIDPDDEDALIDAIEDLKEDSPELFSRSRRSRSVQEDRDDDEDGGYRQRESSDRNSRSARPSRSREGMSRNRGESDSGGDPLTTALLSALGPSKRGRR